jgi:hypothetical protein
MLHNERHAVRTFGRQQQMDVVGHQHVGVNRASETPGELFEAVQIKAIVLLREKHTERLLPR